MQFSVLQLEVNNIGVINFTRRELCLASLGWLLFLKKKKKKSFFLKKLYKTVYIYKIVFGG